MDMPRIVSKTEILPKFARKLRLSSERNPARIPWISDDFQTEDAGASRSVLFWFYVIVNDYLQL